MKKFIFLTILALGVAAQAQTQEYTVTHQCGKGEISEILSVEAQSEGVFTLKANCVPASCSFRGVAFKKYQVSLVPERTSVVMMNPEYKVFKKEVFREFSGVSKQQAQNEVEKLIREGYCHSYDYHSSLDDL